MLNKIFHQSIRTEIMTLIIGNEEVSFTMLKDKIKVTFGNLFIHIEKLEKAGYISSKKQMLKGRSYTSYKATTNGKKEFYEYIDEIEAIITELQEIRKIK